jgi:hypothetical protein
MPLPSPAAAGEGRGISTTPLVSPESTAASPPLPSQGDTSAASTLPSQWEREPESEGRYSFIGPETTLLDMFDANVCGRDFARGKPDPEIFLTAAAALQLPPLECVVVEDAPSGVQAAKSGGMACVGIARLNDQALLEMAGADWVVTSLDDLPAAKLLA